MQHKDNLNWHYISVELEELQITEYERESRLLGTKLFSKKMYPLTQKESDLLTFYLCCGTYGTMKHNVEKKLRKYQPDTAPVTAITKIKYYLGRLIPDEEHYKNYAPFVYRHKLLIPFYLVFRIVRGLIFRRKKISKEMQAMHQIGR